MIEKSLVAQAILILILMKVAFRTNPSPEPFPLRQARNVRFCLTDLGFLRWQHQRHTSACGSLGFTIRVQSDR